MTFLFPKTYLVEWCWNMWQRRHKMLKSQLKNKSLLLLQRQKWLANNRDLWQILGLLLRCVEQGNTTTVENLQETFCRQSCSIHIAHRCYQGVLYFQHIMQFQSTNVIVIWFTHIRKVRTALLKPTYTKLINVVYYNVHISYRLI
jgi:hypothetical protein